LIESDRRASVFWIQNPYNTFRNNIAVGGSYYGYYFDIPNQWIMFDEIGDLVNLRSLPTQVFENNLAYANRHAGLKIEREMVSDKDVFFSKYNINDVTVWGVGSKSGIPDNSGILIEGHEIKIISARIYDSPIGITLNGGNNEIINSEIVMRNFFESEPLAGIQIGGLNNEVHDSMIKGYTSLGEKNTADILLSNTVQHPVSVLINKTRLLDTHSIIFGKTFDPNSEIVVIGYDAPQSPQKGYPENFILKTLEDSKNRYKVKKFVADEDFEAAVFPLNQDDIESFQSITMDKKPNQKKPTKSEIMSMFKSKAYSWSNELISTQNFLKEIQPLLDNKIIILVNFNIDDFDDYNFDVPNWSKKLVGFWFEGKISEEDFTNALKYILQSRIYNYNNYYR